MRAADNQRPLGGRMQPFNPLHCRSDRGERETTAVPAQSSCAAIGNERQRSDTRGDRLEFGLTAEAVAKRLSTERCVRTTGGWKTLCPAHEDQNPSLSVSQAKDGRLL